MRKNAVLIVGASGFIGRKLYSELKAHKYPVIGTYFNNHKEIQKRERIYLDLNKDDFHLLRGLSPLSHVFLCHGIAGIEKCKNKSSYAINVENTVKLLDFIKQLNPNVIPVFFSTSMVYRGLSRYPTESSETLPLNEYGKQKLKVERYIKDNFAKVIILRLTKVFGTEKNDGSLFTAWVEKLIRNKNVYAIKDCFISPIYVGDAIKIVRKLIEGGSYGIYNLGGDYIASYFDLANKLVSSFSFNNYLICETSREELGLKQRLPKFNSVNSDKIYKKVKINPTSLEKCFKILKTSYGLN